MATKERSFWSTTAGIITGTAGVLTAIVGLLTVAVQAGWIGSDGDGADSPGTTTPGASAEAATFTVEPSRLTFENLGPREETVTIENTGTTALNLGRDTPRIDGTHAAQFEVTGNDCGSRLAPGRSCEVTVTFDASRSGQSTAKLVIEPSNARAREIPIEGNRLL